MREYGRHIQKMVEYLLTIEDREKRNIQAKSVIELMGFLNPHLKNARLEELQKELQEYLNDFMSVRIGFDSLYKKFEDFDNKHFER